MSKKKITALILIITFVFSLGVVYSAGAASTDTWFKPNVKFPNMGDSGFFTGYDAEKGYKITPDSIGLYISVVYDYLAGFVGIIAMFMLVIAGWQWLFAAGNADRINNAKQTINGVLIGLALLFGGHIVLEQISVTLTEFEGISVTEITGRTSSCTGLNQQRCGEFSADCRWKYGGTTYNETWRCVGININDLCRDVTNSEVCNGLQGCQWAGTSCVVSTVPRCGLSEEEISGGGMQSVYCCGKDGTFKYSYDPNPHQYCNVLCGEGWGGRPTNSCRYFLDY
jgi:hypothetical protein